MASKPLTTFPWNLEEEEEEEEDEDPSFNGLPCAAEIIKKANTRKEKVTD